MKTITLKTAFILLLSGIYNFKSLAQSNIPTNEYFELSAAALVNDKKTNNYEIAVYLDGKLIESAKVKRCKSINIILESNKVYSLVFTKENYPTRVVIVNTQIPQGMKELFVEPFDFQIELSPLTSTQHKEMEDYPVAVLLIDKKEKLLMASENYYQNTHKDPELNKNDMQAMAIEKKQ